LTVCIALQAPLVRSFASWDVRGRSIDIAGNTAEVKVEI